MAASVSIVIPNYNGVELLRRNLPAVITAADSYPGPAEIIVVDDGSADESAAYVTQIDRVRLVARPLNGGFAAACHSGLQAASHEIVILLNTDVRPFADFIAPLVAAFEDPRMLAVSCLGYTNDSLKEGEGAKLPYFRRGILKFRNARANHSCPTMYAVGGHCALSRSKFMELGGFDQLFAPFYWEDADLCYRGWKRGWITQYEPSSRVIHHHAEGAILKTWGATRSQLIYGRNGFLFVWKNISSRRLLLGRHLPHLIARLLFGFLWLDVRFYRQLWGALPKAAQARRGSRAERRHRVWSDEEIWKRLESLSEIESVQRGLAAQ